MAANQNVTQLTQQTGSADSTSLFYAVTGGSVDTGLPLAVLVHNLGLTGVPTTPTPGSVIGTTQIVNGAYVATYYAPLISPGFSGTPTVPTAAAGTNTTQIASTAYVLTSYATPPAIGNTTPNTGAFTTLSTSGLATLSSLSTASATLTGGSINGTSVGATTPSTGSFTTLAASGAVSGTGFSSYLASPPAIGGTTPAAGTFTTVTGNTSVVASGTNLVTFAGATTGNRPTITTSGSDTNVGLGLVVKGSTTVHIGNATGDWATVTGPTTPANFVQLAGAATGSNAAVTATGSDTNVGLTLSTKGSGTITMATVGSYNSINTVANGVPAEYAQANLSAQAANVAATTIYAVPAGGAGMYRISCYASVTQAATTSSTLPNIGVLWTDNDSGVALSSTTVTPTNTANTLGAFGTGSIIIYAKASTNIQYQTSNYASSGATAMQYGAHIKVEFLG